MSLVNAPGVFSEYLEKSVSISAIKMKPGRSKKLSRRLIRQGVTLGRSNVIYIRTYLQHSLLI